MAARFSVRPVPHGTGMGDNGKGQGSIRTLVELIGSCEGGNKCSFADPENLDS